jgi:hypothetical protein
MRLLLALVLCALTSLARAQAPLPASPPVVRVLTPAEYRLQLQRELSTLDAQLAERPGLDGPIALISMGVAVGGFTLLYGLYSTLDGDLPSRRNMLFAVGGSAAVVLGGVGWMIALSDQRNAPKYRTLVVRRKRVERELRSVELSLSVMPSGGLSVSGRF